MRAISLIILISLIVILVIVFNFSAHTITYKCAGELKLEQLPSTQLDVYTAYEKYRPWVSLWGESDGNFWIESKDALVQYEPDIVDDKRAIRAYRDKKLVGEISKLNGSILIDYSGGNFKGSCIKTGT